MADVQEQEVVKTAEEIEQENEKLRMQVAQKENERLKKQLEDMNGVSEEDDVIESSTDSRDSRVSGEEFEKKTLEILEKSDK